MKQLTFEQYLCKRFYCDRSELQNEIAKNPIKVISYGTDYANNNFEHRVNEVEDKKIIFQTNGMLTDAKNEGFVNGWNECKKQLLNK